MIHPLMGLSQHLGCIKQLGGFWGAMVGEACDVPSSKYYLDIITAHPRLVDSEPVQPCGGLPLKEQQLSFGVKLFFNWVV